jgi:hypothetical protein
LFVYLKDNHTGKLIEAALVENLQIREIELTEENQWRPFIKQCFDELKNRGIPKDRCPQHAKYSLVGTNFISVAIEVSKDKECEDRIALHSLPQSDKFYVKCGMIDLGPDPSKDNLRYFEMTKEQAESFIIEEKD